MKKKYLLLLSFIFCSSIGFGQNPIEIQLIYGKNGQPARSIYYEILDTKGKVLDKGESDKTGKCYITPQRIDDKWFDAIFKCSYQKEPLGSEKWSNLKKSKMLQLLLPSDVSVNDITTKEKEAQNLKTFVRKSDEEIKELRDLRDQLETEKKNHLEDKKEKSILEKEISELKNKINLLEIQRNQDFSKLQEIDSLLLDLKYFYDQNGAPYIDQNDFSWSLNVERSNSKLIRTESLEEFTHVKFELNVKDTKDRKKKYYCRIFYFEFPGGQKKYLSDQVGREKHSFSFEKDYDNFHEFRVIRKREFQELVKDEKVVALGIEVYYQGEYHDIYLVDCHFRVCENYFSQPFCEKFNNE